MPNRTEEFASKAMGKIKEGKAILEGLKGVFRQLTQEHGEVSALLMRVKMSSDPEVRRELFPTIRKQLLAHEKAELREVYPAFQRHPEIAEIASRHAKEADQLEQVIARLHTMAPDSPDWTPTFNRLIELVQHHTTVEENEYFPKAQRVLGNEAEELKRRYENTKAEVMRQLA